MNFIDRSSRTSCYSKNIRLQSTLLGFRVTRNGLFRRKTPKPSPSVSTEGYFKRTSASRHSNSRRRSGKRTSQRASKKNQQPAACTSSPVWFVPPERRRSRRQRRVWREIRYFPDDESPILERINDWSSNVSDDQFDDQKLLLSGDFNERGDDALNSIVSSSLGSFSATSSSSSACPAPKISDFNEEKLFSEELRTSGLLVRGTTWKLSAATPATMMIPTVTPTRTISGNYFASSQFLTFLAKDIVKERSKNESSNTSYRYLSSTDSENNDVDCFNERRKNFPHQRQQYLKKQKSGLRRRPLRRKSQLRRASGQPVFLVRKCSSLRKRPSKIRIVIFVDHLRNSNNSTNNSKVIIIFF